MIEEEAAKGALRLKSNNHWIYEPMVNKGNLTTHTKLNEQLLKAINLNSEGQDQQTTSLNVDISPQKFLDSQSVLPTPHNASTETKFRQINPETLQREHKNSNTIHYWTL